MDDKGIINKDNIIRSVESPKLKGVRKLEDKQNVIKDDIIRSRVSPVVKQRIRQIQEETQQNESEVVRELLNLGLTYHYQIYKLGLKG